MIDRSIADKAERSIERTNEPMQGYHDSNSLSSGEYSDDRVRKNEQTSADRNPYAVAVVPPIGKLLSVISSALAPGGSFRPGNRELARRIGASAGHITPWLNQLAADGWITYDRTSGVITLLGDPAGITTDPVGDPAGIAEGEKKTTDPAGIGDLPHMDAHRSRSGSHDRMIVSSSTHDSESTTTTTGDARGDRNPDRTAAMLLLAELGTVPKLRAQARESRPNLTVQQVRDTWAHFERSIAAGRCTAGAFHAAIARGEVYTPPPPNGLDPEAYRGRDGFLMGGDMPVPTIRDRAQALLTEKWTGANHERMVHDAYFLEACLRDGATDTQALAALAEVKR